MTTLKKRNYVVSSPVQDGKVVKLLSDGTIAPLNYSAGNLIETPLAPLSFPDPLYGVTIKRLKRHRYVMASMNQSSSPTQDAWRINIRVLDYDPESKTFKEIHRTVRGAVYGVAKPEIVIVAEDTFVVLPSVTGLGHLYHYVFKLTDTVNGQVLATPQVHSSVTSYGGNVAQDGYAATSPMRRPIVAIPMGGARFASVTAEKSNVSGAHSGNLGVVDVTGTMHTNLNLTPVGVAAITGYGSTDGNFDLVTVMYQGTRYVFMLASHSNKSMYFTRFSDIGALQANGAAITMADRGSKLIRAVALPNNNIIVAFTTPTSSEICVAQLEVNSSLALVLKNDMLVIPVGNVEDILAKFHLSLRPSGELDIIASTKSVGESDFSTRLYTVANLKDVLYLTSTRKLNMSADHGIIEYLSDTEFLMVENERVYTDGSRSVTPVILTRRDEGTHLGVTIGTTGTVGIHGTIPVPASLGLAAEKLCYYEPYDGTLTTTATGNIPLGVVLPGNQVRVHNFITGGVTNANLFN